MKVFYLLLITAVTHGLSANNPFDWIPNKVVPTTIEELSKALCSSYDNRGYCVDNDLKLILITKVFDFTDSEGNVTEEGCYHFSSAECLIWGQKQLNVNNQCDGLTKTMVTYSKAGINPLEVGSNKYIVSLGGGGLKGKGLKVCKNKNVFIYGLSITDINPELIWGGDALTLDDAADVWIHGNYFCRIGRQMIVTGFGACKNITISYNEFDGATPNSAYCDAHHYWLWLFLGSDDTITLYNNSVHHTSGRGAHVTGLGNSKVFLHMIKNKFVNVTHSGLLEVYYPTGRVLVEGNSFTNVSYIVSKNEGYIFYPFTKEDAADCTKFIGRKCYLNTVVNSGGLNFKSDDIILHELTKNNLTNTAKIDKFDKIIRNFKTLYTNQYSEGKAKTILPSRSISKVVNKGRKAELAKHFK